MDRTIVKTLFAACGVAGLIALSYLFIDRPISEAAYALKQTGWHTLAKEISLESSSSFVKLVLAIGFIFAGLDALNNGLTSRSKHILYICVSISAAIVIGDVFKDIFGRARPPLLFEKGIYGFYPLTGEYLYYSFPSGHTLRAFSSMVAIGYVIPKLRYPALLIAILVGSSRVLALKHYPSDVIFGAFIGTTVAVWGWKILYPYGRTK